MATHIGNEGEVYVGAVKVAEMRGYELTTGIGTADDTVAGDEWETHLTHHKRWSATVDMFWDETATTSQGIMIEGASLVFKFAAEGNTTGDTIRTGTGTIEELGEKLVHDGVTECTVKVKGNGALTRGTV